MQIDKAIVNVQAYLPNDEEILKIIYICGLKPYKDEWKKWVDVHNNILVIGKNKGIFTKKRNLFDKENNKIIDLYFKSSVFTVSENSKWAMISFARSHKEYNSNVSNICYIWFLGKDDRLRLLVFMKNEWIENRLPLTTGIITLRTIAKNLDIQGYKIILGRKKVRGPDPSHITKTWITQWPPSNVVKLDMLLTDQILATKILNDCGVLTK